MNTPDVIPGLTLGEPINLSRRRFLTSTAVGALVIGFGLPLQWSYAAAALGTLVCIALFMKRVRRLSRATFAVDEPANNFGEEALATASK